MLESHFEGKAENLVLEANKSAEHLVALVTSYFTGFQDHAICRCSYSIGTSILCIAGMCSLLSLVSKQAVG